MNVFESQSGHDFVSYHFPRFVDAVEKIAEQMSVEASYPKIPVHLRELFTGHFCPGDEAGGTQTNQYCNLTIMMHELEEELRQQIGEENWKTVERYCTSFAERDSEEMKICFEAGYRAATQLLVAGLTASKPVDEQKREAIF